MRNAFTLFELLVVVAILGILFSLLVPVIGMIREQANKVSCLNNMGQCALGSLTWAAVHRGRPVGALENEVGPFDVALLADFTSARSFWCPSNREALWHTVTVNGATYTGRRSYAVSGTNAVMSNKPVWSAAVCWSDMENGWSNHANPLAAFGDPTHTILFAERWDLEADLQQWRPNRFGDGWGAKMDSIGPILDTRPGAGHRRALGDDQYREKAYNYAMADGHVENLPWYRTCGDDGAKADAEVAAGAWIIYNVTGMWTINSGD